MAGHLPPPSDRATAADGASASIELRTWDPLVPGYVRRDGAGVITATVSAVRLLTDGSHQ